MNGKNVLSLSDTVSMDFIIEKLKKMKAEDKIALHKGLYYEWVSSQETHPLKGTIVGKKYGV